MRLSTLLLLGAAGAQTASASDYDCSIGCSTDPDLMGGRVCGDDGVTYMNECIAVCQNIGIASFNDCNGDGGRFDASDVWDEDSIITVDEMQRFASQTYTFVGKQNPSQFVNAIPQPYENQSEEDGNKVPEEEGPLRVTRVTRDGLVYKAIVALDEDYPPSAPRLPAGYSGRALAILGSDTRSKVSNTQAFPFSTIAEIDYSSSGDGGCSSTVISRNAVLTAGHCVYNAEDEYEYGIYGVAPGRNDRGSNPFGIWRFDYATTFDRWRNNRDRYYDVSVIVLEPQSEVNANGRCNSYIGDVVGYAGLDAPVPNDPRLAGARVIGFGSDKGGEMWTSGNCSPGWERGTKGDAAFGYHYCDTVSGNSGSSALTSNSVALAVHGWAFDKRNGGPLLEGSFYTSVYSSAGLATQASLPNSCESSSGPGDNNGGGGAVGDPLPECPCGDVDFWLFKIVCVFFFFQSCSTTPAE